MHLTETTLDIIQLLGEEPFSGDSIRSLAQKLNKAYPLVHTHISRLREAGLILEEQQGRAIRCTLNFSNPEAQLLLGYTTARNIKKTTLAQQILSLNNERPLVTACQQDDKVWIVTDSRKQQQELKKKLPYAGVTILTTEQYKLFLLEQARTGPLPQPILHNATHYDFVGMLQQALNNVWGAKK